MVARAVLFVISYRRTCPQASGGFQHEVVQQVERECRCCNVGPDHGMPAASTGSVMAKMESTVVDRAASAPEVFGFFLILDETAPKVEFPERYVDIVRRRLGRSGI